jgi:nitrite reductase/ring-hydroxylating ferredoxin subunit/multimeric flavodoxin WrbA
MSMSVPLAASAGDAHLLAVVDPHEGWHRVGLSAQLRADAPLAVVVSGQPVAIFEFEGRLYAISNRCNHKGGPLADGRLHGEFVMCPWHAWEYSVVTGRGPAGYDEEQVPVYAVEERADGVYVRTPPTMPRRLIAHKPSHLLDEHPKPAGAPPRVLGLSTTAMDGVNPRYSTSDALLDEALAHASAGGADVQLIRLRDLAFRHCEGNYSKAAHACTWPCAITERDMTDQLTPVYEGLVHWADVVLIATPIRWGSASSLYYKMAERLNCVQNQITINNRVLIQRKVAALIITGGQDNIQAVAGSMLTFWSELGFVFPPFPFIAHSRGWDAEDMQNNVRLVRTSVGLREASRELVDRALGCWRALASEPPAAPMERAGRKASPLGDTMAVPMAMPMTPPVPTRAATPVATPLTTPNA